MPVNKAKHAIQKAPGAFVLSSLTRDLSPEARRKGCRGGRIGAEFFRHFIRADKLPLT